jgi:hypothetical protein
MVPANNYNNNKFKATNNAISGAASAQINFAALCKQWTSNFRQQKN